MGPHPGHLAHSKANRKRAADKTMIDNEIVSLAVVVGHCCMCLEWLTDNILVITTHATNETEHTHCSNVYGTTIQHVTRRERKCARGEATLPTGQLTQTK